MALPAVELQGYPKLAYLMGRYPEYAIFRKFGSLGMISLLAMQAKLARLEQKFQEASSKSQTPSQANAKQQWTDFEKLQSLDATEKANADLLEDIRKTVNEYYELLDRACRVEHLAQPSKPQLRFLEDWLEGDQEGENFLPENIEFFTWNQVHADDFVTLKPSTSWIKPSLMDFLQGASTSRGAKNNQQSSDDCDEVSPPQVNLGRVRDRDSTKRVKLVRWIWDSFITLFASMLPILAILVLYFVHDTLYRIAITIGFTAFVSLFLIIFTETTLKDIFLAAAAFGAIAVVFIGSVSDSAPAQADQVLAGNATST